MTTTAKKLMTVDELIDYFQVPGIENLVIDPEAGPVVHHQGQDDGTILARLLTHGEIGFDPPGLTIAATELLD